MGWVLLIFYLFSRLVESSIFEPAVLKWGFAFISLITLSFFPTYTLYNYTRFFSRKIHLVILNKALFWGFITLCTVLFLCMETNLFIKYFAAVILFAVLKFSLLI